jgi:hypothetical protein
VNRRQHVLPLGHRSQRGNRCHWVPVRNTWRIPSRHGRSGVRGAPPLGSGGWGGSRDST